jgi:hypothetical protein
VLVWLAVLGCDRDEERRALPPPRSATSGAAPQGTIELATVGAYTGPGLGIALGGADLDGDGVADLVTAGADAIWSVTDPVGSGPVASAGVEMLAPSWPQAVVDLGDTDGDGTTEVALPYNHVGGIVRSSEPFAGLLMSGADPSQPSAWIHDPYLDSSPLGTTSYWMVALGDTDGDGLGELAVAAPDGVYLLRGPFPEVLLLGTDEDAVLVGPRPRELASGDFDGDGVVDLGIGVEEPPSVWIVPGDLQGEVEMSAVAFASAPAARALYGADLDGDGADDLVMGQEESTALARGPLQREVQDPLDVVGSPLARPVGDLDGDGADELAALDDPYAVRVWYGPHTGLRELADADVVLVLEPDDGSFAARFAGLGDVDGDGTGELAIGSPLLGETYVIFGGAR